MSIKNYPSSDMKRGNLQLYLIKFDGLQMDLELDGRLAGSSEASEEKIVCAKKMMWELKGKNYFFQTRKPANSPR
jgi:hypothetical protein